MNSSSSSSRSSSQVLLALLHDEQTGKALKLSTGQMDSTGALTFGAMSGVLGDDLTVASSSMFDPARGPSIGDFGAANSDDGNSPVFLPDSADFGDDQPIAGGPREATLLGQAAYAPVLPQLHTPLPEDVASPVYVEDANRNISGASLPNPFELLDPHVPASMSLSRPIRKGRAVRPRVPDISPGISTDKSSCVSALKLIDQGLLPVWGVVHPRLRTFLKSVLGVFQPRLPADNSPHSPSVPGLERQSSIPAAYFGPNTYSAVEAVGDADNDSDDGWDLQADVVADFGYDFADFGTAASHMVASGSWEQTHTQQEQGPVPRQHMSRGSSESYEGTYEALCREYLDKFTRGADRFARESQLSVRVRDWTERLEPQLSEQESRPSFDMHAYSARFLASLTAVSELRDRDAASVPAATAKSRGTECSVVSFGDVLGAQQPQFEVCRMFLACLQLANHNNVDIVRSGVDLASLDLQLLTEQRSQDIENYRAPSVVVSR